MLLRIVLLSLTLCAYSVYAADSDKAEGVGASPKTAAALATLLADTQSMQAKFSQRVVSDEGELLEESRGSMAFQRPNQLRWEIIEPYRYLVLTNGETLWRYDPDFEQLSTESFRSVAQTPMLILAASAAELDGQYLIEAKTVEGEQQFDLKPRSKDAEFTRLVLAFTGKLLSEMQLTDKLGQETTIALTETRLNRKKLADKLFEFDSAGTGSEQ